VGFTGRVVIDADAANVRDAVTGGNRADYHLRHVLQGRDFQAQVAPLRDVRAGDICPSCGASLGLYRGIEAGHIFLLGTHYSSKMNAGYLDEKGETRPIVMGCYGIGVSRLVAAAVEQHHDDDGITWPSAIAPYDLHLVQVGVEPEVVAAVERLEKELEERGIDVLIDDRDERPGVKFKDSDLIGIPFRITVGAKSLKNGGVEFKPRSERDPKKAELIPLETAAEAAAKRISAELHRSEARG
jgi:prolyl-tRNA synthetase